MSTKHKWEENLDEVSHEQMLDNKSANYLCKLANYQDYIKMGFDKELALNLTGLKKQNNDRDN